MFRLSAADNSGRPLRDLALSIVLSLIESMHEAVIFFPELNMRFDIAIVLYFVYQSA